MSIGVEVHVEDGFATVVFLNPGLRRAGVGRLLDAADDPRLVVKVTSPTVGYIVPVGVAAAAGFLDEPPPETPDMSWNRSDLNTFAARAGVPGPGKLRTKQDVLAAITAL